MVGRICAVVVDVGSTFRFCGSGGAAPRLPPPGGAWPAGAWADRIDPANIRAPRTATVCFKRMRSPRERNLPKIVSRCSIQTKSPTVCTPGQGSGKLDHCLQAARRAFYIRQVLLK